jgi:hypothetical protein
MNSKSASSF